MIGVFGSSGFIGRNFVDFLNEREIEFMRFQRTDDGLWRSNTRIGSFGDRSSYEPYLDRLETAVLLVSASVPSTFPNSLHSEVEENVVPYARFLDSIGGSSLKKLIFLSSGGAVYGAPNQEHIDEQHQTMPISNYGVGKLMIENAICASAFRADWNYSILRVSNPVGKFQGTKKRQGIVAAAIDAAFTKRHLEVWGDGSALRDYIHVRDVCSAILAASKTKACVDQIYNVGSGEAVSVTQIIEYCREILKIDLQTNHSPDRDFLVKDILLDSSKFRGDTNWSPSYTVKEAISDTIEHYKTVQKSK
ncbi:MAG: NAD-dependent epimerase/dehydratase family protein [Pseudomonadota bacterium]